MTKLIAVDDCCALNLTLVLLTLPYCVLSNEFNWGRIFDSLWCVVFTLGLNLSATEGWAMHRL
ncbi:TPA: hypothetical protein MJA25_003292 [Klebsiella aerogenes]|nr:hypothetical protein [Klebsiella aerogenes]HBW0090282.1 hypothetical protein [Klebsiella aerogenes]HBY9530479.1 hypothetical protein [Klebsiella aerogenes]